MLIFCNIHEYISIINILYTINTMIPKIIHQTWKDKNLPDILQKIVNHNKNLLEKSGYEFKLWTDDDIKTLINKHYPHITMVWDAARTGVQKGDIARLLLLHHYGGIYMDLDILILKDFEEFPGLIDLSQDKFYLSYEPEAQTVRIYNKNDYLCNAFMAANKGNEMIGYCIMHMYTLHQRFNVTIMRKFDVFGGDYIKGIYESYLSYQKDCHIIETREQIYPINDPKFNNLPTSKTDWDLLRLRNYSDRTYVVHYWIHGDFESKNLLEDFKCNPNNDVHEDVYQFFSRLYPDNAKLFNQ